jgi:hypothetical protein
MTERDALVVIERYYRDDPEGLLSDLSITIQRAETLSQWAESLLDEIA